MNTSIKQLASNRKAASPALLVAFMAAALLVAMWAFATPTAYADETDTDSDSSQTITYSGSDLAELESLDIKEFEMVDQAKSWDPSFTFEGTTLDELKSDEGHFIRLVTTKDTDVDMVVIELAGDQFLGRAISEGTLKEGTTYLIEVLPDATVMSVSFYQKVEEGPGEAEESKRGSVDDPNTDDTAETPEDITKGGGTSENPENATKAGDNPEGTTEGGDNPEGTTEGGDNPEGTSKDNQSTEENANEEEKANGEEQDGKKDTPGAVIVAEQVTQEETAETNSTTVSTKVYSMSIGKVDAQSNTYLEGAEFTMKTSSGEVVASWVSSAYGPQQIDGLRTDTTYVLSETKAPAGYNREHDINIKYDAGSNRVLIDQGGASVALDNNSDGCAVLNVKDMKGQSSVQTSASTSPKTGDNQMLPIIVGVLVVVVAVAAAVAVKARKSAKK